MYGGGEMRRGEWEDGWKECGQLCLGSILLPYGENGGIGK